MELMSFKGPFLCLSSVESLYSEQPMSSKASSGFSVQEVLISSLGHLCWTGAQRVVEYACVRVLQCIVKVFRWPGLVFVRMFVLCPCCFFGYSARICLPPLVLPATHCVFGFFLCFLFC